MECLLHMFQQKYVFYMQFHGISAAVDGYRVSAEGRCKRVELDLEADGHDG